MPPRRSKTEIQEWLGRIEELLQETDGIAPSDLQAKLSARHEETIPPRTLRRWLDALVQDGRARPLGKGRARVYRAITDGAGAQRHRPDGTASATAKPSGGRDEFPLSRAAAELRRTIRQPQHKRTPVGYDQALLDDYLPGQTWYLEEETRQELSHLGAMPDPMRPAGTYARDILGRLLIDLSWASSHLEGNTYSRLDTQNLIEFGQRAEGKSAEEAQMILNHKKAIEFLVEGADLIDFDRRTVLTLHTILSENLLADPTMEGRVRTGIVGISGTTYTPSGIPQVVESCFETLLEKARAIPDPFEQALFVMVQIPYLQPFIDVNKRTSRLAANVPLIKSNLCPLSFVDVPRDVYVDATIAVYEQRRVEFLAEVFSWAYRRSCAQYRVLRDALGQPDPIRLRYREQLARLVKETVETGVPPDTARLRAWGDGNDVDPSDLNQFADRAMELLLALHEGSIARYGISPAEFRAWRVRAPT